MWYGIQNSKLMVRQNLLAEPLSGFAELLRNLHAHRVLQGLIVMIVAHVGAAPVYAELAYKSDFETGAIQSRSSNWDGWLRQTMDESCSQNPPRGLGCVENVDYSYSDNVVTSDGRVLPRAGKHFVRLEVREGDNPLRNVYNERSNLLQAGTIKETHIPYNTTGWIQWSVYMPDQANEPDYAEIQTQVNPYPDVTGGHMLIFSRRHGVPSESTPNSMRMQGYYWETNPDKRVQIGTAAGEFGRLNPIPIYYDEWVDFRIELKAHEVNGRCILWQRFPERDNVWTKVLDYSGPLGYPDSGTYRISQSSYGGGNFPRILYLDEMRITHERIGSAKEVDIPTDVSPPKAPILLEE